jgi:hypothetical protein
MTFTKEEERYLEQQKSEVDSASIKNNYLQAQLNQQALEEQERNKSMIKEQLDLSNEIITIKHLLRGHVLEEDENGILSWQDSQNPDLKLLTEYGVNYLVQFITYYSTKNTLLSNYDEETINLKMEDIATTLADRVFMNYEKFFKYPTVEECEKILMDRIEKKVDIRKFAYKLSGITREDSEIRKEFIKEIENNIEKELDKIREQTMKDKLKAFESLIRVIQDFIHSSYNRAYGGQERRTLRQHIHINENRNPTPMPVKKPSKLNILNYG